MKLYIILVILIFIILLCFTLTSENYASFRGTNKENFCGGNPYRLKIEGMPYNRCSAYSCGVRGNLLTATFNDIMSHPQLLYPPNPMQQI